MLDYGRARIETTRPRRASGGWVVAVCSPWRVVGQQDMVLGSVVLLVSLCWGVCGIRARVESGAVVKSLVSAVEGENVVVVVKRLGLHWPSGTCAR